MFHTNGRTEVTKHITHFSQFCECAQKGLVKRLLAGGIKVRFLMTGYPINVRVSNKRKIYIPGCTSKC